MLTTLRSMYNLALLFAVQYFCGPFNPILHVLQRVFRTEGRGKNIPYLALAA